jgi:cobalt-zinc-cadmium efflux system protein
MLYCQNPNCYQPHQNPKIKLLLITLILIGSFSIIEFLVALSTHSLALKAESAHIISDSLALILALIASWMATKTIFVNHKIEIWAALINGLGLFFMGSLIIWEALDHLKSPPTEIISLPMLITALLGLIINSINAFILHKDSKNDLNVKGAFLHIIGDIISSIGIILAAISIWLFNFYWADTIISLFVAILITLTAIPLIIESYHKLLTKQAIIENYLKKLPEIIQIEKLQLNQNILTLHLLVKPTFNSKIIETDLQKKFKLDQISITQSSLLEIGKVSLKSLLNQNKILR